MGSCSTRNVVELCAIILGALENIGIMRDGDTVVQSFDSSDAVTLLRVSAKRQERIQSKIKYRTVLSIWGIRKV